ncbi:MAG: hypothetical protein C75L2_00650005 [Leptospirillum sp. Group II 'C75']|jgi:hypothetical protein|uniref:hypothetical protein n=1 Tax=Leptospirillum sp. Group II 'CF-1' TaxID=1660083 RepID=UPI00029CC1DD|nr:hypothetical protein [Leptospirillum sp. Group II 'CF-1']EIJ75759.1 MAG: hypothetical protein C75L2_00650005 [Leptospirillum sp. Group II 'C75']
MTKINAVQVIISLASICLLGVHLFKPTIAIDSIALFLLAFAAIPWIFPFLKSLELPGGIKIELKDTKAATDKVISSPIQAKEKITKQTQPRELPQNEMVEFETIKTLRQIAEADSNLAFVGFRIEIEKRLRELAEMFQINSRQPLTVLLRSMQGHIIPNEVASGLSDLIALGNQAAHGSKVDPAAINWLLDVGPSILASMDNLIDRSKNG